jgi:hypothetical protein
LDQAFLFAHEDDRNYDLAQRIQCIFFLATPHRGSDFAAILNNILKSTKILTPRAYVADLEKNSPTLQLITDEFIKRADHLQIWSFYETLKTKISAINSVMIVEPKSAILGKNSPSWFLLLVGDLVMCRDEK